MPSIKREEQLPNVLETGDHITVTMSHQIYIDGDQTWVTYKVSTSKREDEESHDAHRRLLDYTTAAVRSTVKETVRNVRKISGQEGD